MSSRLPHGAQHVDTPFDYFAGWLIVSGEPGEAEVQEEDHDVTQTEVADGDIMDGEAETDSVVIAGQPEVLSSQEMQVGRQIIQHSLLQH